MNKLSGFLAVSALAGLCTSFAANADDIVTLSYQSAPLVGTYSSLPTGQQKVTERLAPAAVAVAPAIGTVAVTAGPALMVLR